MATAVTRPERLDPIRWTGTPERAVEIDAFTRNSALVARWQWSPLLNQPARLLIEPDGLDLSKSAEWVVVPLGAVISRLVRDDQDSVLRVAPDREASG